MSTRGQRFFKTTPTQTQTQAPIVGASVVYAAEPAKEGIPLTTGMLVLTLGMVSGFALHNRIKGTNTFRGARKDARKARTIARREYGRLASKFGG